MINFIFDAIHERFDVREWFIFKWLWSRRVARIEKLLYHAQNKIIIALGVKSSLEKELGDLIVFNEHIEVRILNNFQHYSWESLQDELHRFKKLTTKIFKQLNEARGIAGSNSVLVDKISKTNLVDQIRGVHGNFMMLHSKVLQEINQASLMVSKGRIEEAMLPIIQKYKQLTDEDAKKLSIDIANFFATI